MTASGRAIQNEVRCEGLSDGAGFTARFMEIGPEEIPDAEIQRLIEGLDSLREGEQSACKLAACGPRAIGPLREFLFRGRPSGICQPRRWAVMVLGSAGAKDVLIEYLRWEKQIPDPVARFGEESVESAAARALMDWRTEEVFQLFLELGRKRLLPDVVEALGEFGRGEAVPILDRALEDDLCREAAQTALRKLGEAARPALAQSAITPLPSA